MLVKILIKASACLYKVMREFVRYIHLVANIVACENLAQGRLAAGIYVGSIEIIDPCLIRRHNLATGLVHVNRKTVLRETHTAESQCRYRVLIPVLAILHNFILEVRRDFLWKGREGCVQLSETVPSECSMHQVRLPYCRGYPRIRRFRSSPTLLR